MASVVKRCDHRDKSKCRCNWVVRWRAPNGRQREQSYLWDQKRLANDLALKVEHDKRAGVFGDPSAGNVPLAQYLETWIIRHPGTDNTKTTYRSSLANHIGPELGDVPLNKLKRDQLTELLTETLPAKGLRENTIRTARTLLVGALSEAVRSKVIAENPAAAIRLPDHRNQRADFELASRDQLETVAAEMPEDQSLAIWLMRGCGLRIGEALAVRRDNVRGDVLRVEQQVLQSRELGPLKHRKPGEWRDIPLPRYVAERIGDHCERFGIGPADYLFPGFAKGIWGQSSWRMMFQRKCKGAGLPGFNPHDLRHTFASVALANGIPITDVSRWLGHRDINQTHRVYGHLVPSNLGRARDVLDREFAES